jgi:hypothetical protein
MGKYSARNLIKYEEAIELHLDTTEKIAWLSLKNYGFVFHRYPWVEKHRRGDVFTVIIGIPAGDFTEEERSTFQMRREDVRNARPEAFSRSISASLDAIDVIRLQQGIMQRAGAYSQGGVAYEGSQQVAKRKGLATGTLFGHIVAVLKGMGFEDPGKGNSYHDLRSMLASARGAHWISNQIANQRREEAIASETRKVKISSHRRGETGMTAYFPEPSFIIEEQRTALFGGLGHTKRQDTRFIAPLRARPTEMATHELKTVPFSFQAFLDELDADRMEQGMDFVMATEGREASLHPTNFPKGAAYLHRHIQQINCYAFRGDARDPMAIRRANGFLPGVTRTDSGADAQKQIKIDNALNPTTATSRDEYKKVVQELDLLTLGVFTKDESFKAFVSTTTSTAIAKCFANLYSSEPDHFAPSFCYAVRSKGFHLPTHKEAYETWVAKKDAHNAMTHFAEQEVAVPGAIWWEDVVGVRLIRVDMTGQFFSGPVFLKDVLRKELWTAPTDNELLAYPDNDAFDELFELLSGKSQGKGFQIEWSYERAPFDCPSTAMRNRGLYG